jgi:peptidoglycan/LPS O-acetylase OafA/YrhL
MNAPSNETTNGSLARDWLYAARYYLGKRRAILLLAMIAVVAGITLNWGWLVATGIAPILLAALPCLIMCGLGLCMNRFLGGSCELSTPPATRGRTTVGRLSCAIAPHVDQRPDVSLLSRIVRSTDFDKR